MTSIIYYHLGTTKSYPTARLQLGWTALGDAYCNVEHWTWIKLAPFTRKCLPARAQPGGNLALL